MTDPTAIPSEHLDGNAEPCPTPLAWQEVVQAFLETRRQGAVTFSRGTVQVTQFGEGLPLVFLPTPFGSPNLYALTAWLIKEGRQCFLFGHPQFDRTPSPSSLVGATADAFGEVMQNLFGGPVDVYAPTLSAQIALQLMVTSPSSVRRSMLQSSIVSRRLTFSEKAMLTAGRLAPFRIQRVPLWLSTQIQNHRRWFPPYDETRFGFLLRETYSTPVRDAARRILASARADVSASLSSIENEIFVLRCEGDGRLISEQEDLLERSLPNFRSDWLHTTGHYPFLTHPHRLVKVMREFFEIPKPE